jgi:NAD kinase
VSVKTEKDPIETFTAKNENTELTGTEIKSNNNEFMIIRPAIKYLCLTARSRQREEESIKNVFSKISQKTKNAIDDKGRGLPGKDKSEVITSDKQQNSDYKILTGDDGTMVRYKASEKKEA